MEDIQYTTKEDIENYILKNIDDATPEIVESGRFVHVILTIPTGTATATEIFRGQVLIKGRFI